MVGISRKPTIVGLDRADVQEVGDGLIVMLRRSKTDQEGEGYEKGLPWGSNPLTCPVRTFRAWVELAGVTSGPLWRPIDRHGNIGRSRLTDQSVALIVKRAAKAAVLDPARFAGHSLRAGFATSAGAAGVEEREIMAQTGHRSVTVLRGYIRHGSLFRTNAAAKVGL